MSDLLNRPLSRFWCVTSWFASVGLIALVIQFFGGVTPGDSAESVYSTWSVAHFNLSCAYPPLSHFSFPNATSPFASVSPLYPVISAIVSAVFRIGHNAPFPTNAAMGAHCSNAYVAIYKWSILSGALQPTIKIAYLGWIVLMVSVVVLLRMSGHGRNGWEAVTLLLLATVPSVWGCIATFFHPQDLVSMGCILFAATSAIRGKWTWVGVLLGLAFASQQFAVLAIASMIVIVPRDRRLSFIAGTVSSLAVIDGPFIILTSGRALRTAIFGSSRITIFGGSSPRAAGGTILFAAHMQGATLFLVSRAAPVVCAIVFTIWVARRLGSRVTELEILLSLLATDLCTRLIFEENLFGYYFMAVAVTVLCVEAVRGRISGRVFVWIGMVTLAFDPIPWWLYLKWEMRGVNLFMALPTIFEVLVLGAFLFGVLHRHIRWYLLASSIIVAFTCFPPLWGRAWVPVLAPHWLWQIILVPAGLVLASDSLRSAIRSHQPNHSLEAAQNGA